MIPNYDDDETNLIQGNDLISDLYAGKATSKYLNIPSGFKNIGLNRYGKFRAMDFLATPVTTKAIEIYRQYLNALKKAWFK